jgi:type II secretory pathway predicted ATPase ExeA
MSRRPFRPAVDTGSYFPAAAHEAAHAAVDAAFHRHDAVVLVDGPPGVGKSLVARRWLEHLPPEIPRVVVPNVHAAKPADLLQAILFDLNQPYQGLSEQELRLAVTGQLLTAAAGGRPTVLVVDEAQHLTHPAIEELRLLGNVETDGGAALFTLLVAQPALRDVFARPGYASFAQRIAALSRVEPFTPAEAADYLRHQVRAAGGNPAKVFDDGTVALLTGACGGVARVLNRAAGLAADLAAEGEADLIDAEAVLEALSRLGLEAEEADEPLVLAHPRRSGEPAPAARPKAETVRGPAVGRERPAGTGSKQKAGRKKSA